MIMDVIDTGIFVKTSRIKNWDCFVAMLLAKTKRINPKEGFDFEPGGVLTTFDLVEVDLGDGKAGIGEGGYWDGGLL